MMEVKRTPTSAYMVDDFQHKLKDRKRKFLKIFHLSSTTYLEDNNREERPQFSCDFVFFIEH